MSSIITSSSSENLKMVHHQNHLENAKRKEVSPSSAPSVTSSLAATTTLKKSLSMSKRKRRSFFGGGGGGGGSVGEAASGRETPLPVATKCVQDWPNAAGFDYHEDVTVPVKLNVIGEIPDYVRGVLYRIGPGGHTLTTDAGGTFSIDHWFDGFSQIHRFNIIDSKTIYYNSRHTCDSLIEDYRRQGNMGSRFSFGQGRDPCKSVFSKFMSVFKPGMNVLDDPVGNRSRVNVGVTMSTDFPGLPSTLVPDGDVPGGIESGEGIPISSLCAKTDNSTFQLIHPTTLEPVGIAQQTILHPDLKGPMSAAHAKSCPITGDVFNFNLEFGKKSTYRVFSVSRATGKTTILATIDDAVPAYLHSFWLTSRFVVLCVWGSGFKYGGIGILWNRNVVDSIEEWDGSRRAKFYVVDRSGKHGVVGVYDTEAFYCFHTVNAWEEDVVEQEEEVTAAEDSGKQKKGEKKKKEKKVNLVLEACVFENTNIIKKFYYRNFLGNPSPKSIQNPGFGEAMMRRYVLPNLTLPTTLPGPNVTPTTNTTSSSASSTTNNSNPHPPHHHSHKPIPAKTIYTLPPHQNFELPTINPLRLTLPHRYTYGLNTLGASTLLETIVKFDSKGMALKTWSVTGHTPGEVIFIPRGRVGKEEGEEADEEEEKEEDDGVLLSVVLDGIKGKSYLLCLDARELTELGRAEMESVVAFGFHGKYVGVSPPQRGFTTGEKVSVRMKVGEQEAGEEQVVVVSEGRGACDPGWADF